MRATKPAGFLPVERLETGFGSSFDRRSRCAPGRSVGLASWKKGVCSMSTRKSTPSRRSLRPQAESLETRQLLSSLSTTPSATVSGTDTKGDRWTLRLYGPGTMNVVDANGNAFTSATRNTPHDINTITVSGTVTSQSRLVGKVTFVPTGSDGRVFFQQLTIAPTGAYPFLDPNLVRPRVTTPQNGIAAVDMPRFWLGDTSGVAPTLNSNFHSVP